MSGAGPDLIAGYLAGLRAGLGVAAGEAGLIVAEAEDHLREAAAAGVAAGLPELEAQRRAISRFGPARAVARAHRWRAVTAGGVALAGWKLAGLLAVIIGAGGITGMEAFEFGQRSAPMGPDSLDPLVILYAALAVGGLALLVAHRLGRRGTAARDLLSPGVTAGCLLLASPVLWIYGYLVRSVSLRPAGSLSCTYSCNWSNGRPPPGAAFGLALMVLVAYVAMAAGILVLLAARRLARRRAPGRGRTPGRGRRPLGTATCFLLASAPLLVLIGIRLYLVKGQAVPLAPMISEYWLTPVSQGSTSAAPLVSGAIVAACLALAVGFGIQAAAFRLARRGRVRFAR